MTVDLTRVLFHSNYNAFKNTGVYTTSITASGTVGAGAIATFTSVVELDEDQDLAYAIAQYVEYTKLGSATYQPIPVYDAYIPATSGLMRWAIIFVLDGSTVTFTLFAHNQSGSPEVVTETTIPITYVTYTLAN